MKKKNPAWVENGSRGRGARDNPKNRFETLELVADETPIPDEEEPRQETHFLPDMTRSILSHNDSPDIPFDTSINPYRGCEHGCVYCYARPTHEYLGFSLGLDFETRIMVKENAPDLLRRELMKKSWKPQPIAISGVTDPYQPIERKKELTRRCLEVLLDFRNPAMIVTKNHLVTRDLDLFREMNLYRGISVTISIPSLDDRLVEIMEPRTSRPRRRLDALRQMAEAGIPTGVLVAPVIPAITVEGLPGVLKAAGTMGAEYAAYILLRLPHGVSNLFADWLERHFPERRNKVIGQIKQSRDGKMNDPNFGSRMKGSGLMAEQINQLFHMSCTQAGIPHRSPELSIEHFRIPRQRQDLLFELN